MQFTYDSYRDLLILLHQHNYVFETYHTWQNSSRCVILRHDIDQSIDNAVAMAEIEAGIGAIATYFVLLTGEFYNIAAPNTLSKLKRIHAMGHEIGLHFDETAYTEIKIEKVILHEANILSLICGFPITSVSMHRPSQITLERNLQVDGMINSYGQTFFHDFKYISDSRRCWKESVEDIVALEKYKRLHILTHAFWYSHKEKGLKDTVKSFINSGSKTRYRAMRNNITDLPSIMQESEVR